MLRFTRLAPAGILVLAPAAAIAGGLALAPLVGVAGVVNAFSIRLQNLAKPHILLILFAAFLAWAISSTLWLQAANHGQALRLAGVGFGGLLFFACANPDASARRLLEAAGAAALITLAALCAIEAFANLPLNRAAQPGELRDWVLQRNPGRAVSILVVLAWAILGALLARGRPARLAGAAILAAAVGVLSTQFGMQANLAAFAVGVGVFAFAYVLRGAAIITIGAGIASWLLAAPFLTPLIVSDSRFESTLPQSWIIRAEVWKFACARILEHPWIGQGLDASRSYRDTVSVAGVQMHRVPLHPHSGSLQIWLETGAVGAVLGAATIMVGVVVLARALKSSRAACAAAAATLASFGLIANVSYGVWQEWWIATAFIAAALVAAIPFKREAR